MSQNGEHKSSRPMPRDRSESGTHLPLTMSFVADGVYDDLIRIKRQVEELLAIVQAAKEKAESHRQALPAGTTNAPLPAEGLNLKTADDFTDYAEDRVLLPIQSFAESESVPISRHTFVESHAYPVESEMSDFGLSVHRNEATSHIEKIDKDGNRQLVPVGNSGESDNLPNQSRHPQSIPNRDADATVLELLDVIRHQVATLKHEIKAVNQANNPNH